MNKLSFFWCIQIQTNSIHFGKNNIYSLNWANYTERLFFVLLHENFTLCSPKISDTSAAPDSRDKYNVCASVVAIFQKNIISPWKPDVWRETIFKHNIHVTSDWHSNHISHSYHKLPIIIEKLSSDCFEVRRAFVKLKKEAKGETYI